MKKHYVNRELSWIQFNARVLEEACNPENPLLEQGKFISICESNLDEFFMVRVGSLERELALGSKKKDVSGMTAYEQLMRINIAVRKQIARQYEILNDYYLPALRKAGISLLRIKQLDGAQHDWLSEYFDREVAPLLTPYAIDPRRPFPLLAARCLHLAILLPPRTAGGSLRFALLPVPQNLSRVVMLPMGQGRARGVLLEDVITAFVDRVLGVRPIVCQPFRLTRNTDFFYNDSNAETLIVEMKRNLKKRKFGQIVRMEIPDQFDNRLMLLLKKYLGVQSRAVFSVPGPLNPNFFMKQLSSLEGFDDLRFPPFTAHVSSRLEDGRDIFSVIREGDLFFHHPYDAFSPVLRFLDEAADDPDVLAIKQTLYRVSGKSPIVAALERAAKNGKQVTVLIEVRARFDEESNINWCQTLEKAGCHVIYGVPNYKCHSKITLVIRREAGALTRYVHLGTGNYNDVTAGMYTDMGLLTADSVIGEDAGSFFNSVTGFAETASMRKLVASPEGIRERLNELIENEVKRAENDEASGITIKINGFTDRKMIKKLYKAADKGVPVHMIVRGPCCLNIKKHPNVEVRSIVGRFLEHARCYIFHNEGDPVIYLSSADLMTRNLDKRVELMFPIEDEEIKQRILRDIGFETEDTAKAWVLQKNGAYLRAARVEEPAPNAQERNIAAADPAYVGLTQSEV
ncbi:MAG: polyphosphate kinase 1 [Clostridia bacterium]|nr:polyphosphate kinase 1 [Clostridia bacterium]